MTTQGSITCDVCGASAPLDVEYMEIDMPAGWLYRDGRDHCPQCAAELPPKPEPEPYTPLTQASVAYMAALDDYVRSKVPDAVGILSEDRKTVTYKFIRKDERDR